MNKIELLASLSALPWCGGIVEEKPHETKPDGTLWCGVTFREIDTESNTMSLRNANFYVVSPNSVDETAYWQNDVPTPTLAANRETTESVYKMITLRTMMDQFGFEEYVVIRQRMEAAAAENIAIADVLHWMKNPGPDAGIDINAAKTQYTIMGMVPDILTIEQAETLITLADANHLESENIENA
jgi:hypothetical protein